MILSFNVMIFHDSQANAVEGNNENTLYETICRYLFHSCSISFGVGHYAGKRFGICVSGHRGGDMLQ